MRRSPRRPLILKRRKLPFQQNDPPTAKPQTPAEVAPDPKAPPKASTNQAFLDGVRVMDHPSMSDTQVVVIPKTADLQSVIGALTAKGKEHGARGPNKFILLSGSDCHDNGSLCQAAAEGQGSASASMCGQPVKPGSVCHTPDVKPLSGTKTLNKELDCSPLDESLTNIQWLGGMSSRAMDSNPAQQNADKENRNPIPQTLQTPAAHVDAEAAPRQPMSERPPYSYMAMIQFAINSRKNRRMTLKEIYNWIEDHFPYFREVAKPGWKNSIRHNLSLHDMFTRETSTDGKVSFWTIRPEANRCLTLDQVFKPDSDPITTPVPVSMLLLPQQPQKRMLPDSRKKPIVSEKRMKPLLPRTDSYLVPIQLPVTPSIYLPPSASPQFSLSGPQQRRSTSRGTKRVRIAPKVTHSDASRGVERRSEGMEVKTEIKEEAVQVPIRPETPKAPPRRQSSSSRRKQRLVHSTNDEPVLVCPDNTFLDSGVALDTSTFHERQDVEPDEQPGEQHSPDREFSFKTPIKSTNHLVSSTPSKPPSSVPLETWKVTPLGKGSQSILDFSPIRTPGGPAVTPRHDYTTFSFNGTPFKDLPLFSSPRELLSSSSRGTGAAESPVAGPPSGCSTPGNRSLTEGLILDTMNDSLSKILVDISFSGLYDDDLGTANISWSELIPQLK